MDNSQLPYCTSHFALRSFETEVKPGKVDGVIHQHFIMGLITGKQQMFHILPLKKIGRTNSIHVYLHIHYMKSHKNNNNKTPTERQMFN